MRYITIATAMTDELHFADGTVQDHIPGGAGLYALAGMRVWREEAGLVSGVGSDYLYLHGHWYAQNHIPTEGLIIKDEHTPHNLIQYFADGERSETPRYGPEHFAKIDGTAKDIGRFTPVAEGVYAFRNLDRDFWDTLLPLKARDGFTLMWEFAADAARPENKAMARKLAQQVELLSINESESHALLGAKDLTGVIAELLSWQLPAIFLRVGAQGAYALANGRAALVPSAGGLPVVDVTGGGNSFSGAALVGWCQSKDAVRAAAMGNVAAAFNIAQFGPPSHYDAAMKQKADAMLSAILNEVH